MAGGKSNKGKGVDRGRKGNNEDERPRRRKNDRDWGDNLDDADFRAIQAVLKRTAAEKKKRIERAKQRDDNGPAFDDGEDEDEDEPSEEDTTDDDDPKVARHRRKERERAELAVFRRMWQEGIFDGMRQPPAATPGASGSGSGSSSSSRRHVETDSPARSDSRPVEKKIARPRSQGDVKIKDIRNILGLGGHDGHQRWLQIRCVVRDLVTRANLDVELMWSHQDKSAIMLLYQSLRKSVRKLDRAQNNWIAEYLAREAFTHRRNHWLARQRGRGGELDGSGHEDAGSNDRRRRKRQRPTEEDRDVATDGDDPGRMSDGDEHGRRKRRSTGEQRAHRTPGDDEPMDDERPPPLPRPRPRPRMRLPESPGAEACPPAASPARADPEPRAPASRRSHTSPARADPERTAPEPHAGPESCAPASRHPTASPTPEPGAPTLRGPAVSPARPEHSSRAAPSHPPTTPAAHAHQPPPPEPTSEPRASTRVAKNAAKKAAEAEQAKQAAEAANNAGPATKGKKSTRKSKATKSKAAAKPKGKGRVKQPAEEGKLEDPDGQEDNGAEDELDE